jgi:transcriptional regulator with PAS, ATPase and Fis domain
VSTNPATLTLLRDVDQELVELPGLALRLRSPGAPDVEVKVGLEPLVVGSSPECHVRTSDPSVSRLHCRVQLTAEGVVIRDLGSKNGLVAGGLRVREAVMQTGGAVTLGASSLTLVPDGQPTVVPLAPGQRFGDALGASVPMRALFARLESAAASDLSILLLGESGTGKELLARAIHACGGRRDGPFVVLDCGALAPSLVEAELFGHARGAFTGAVAARAGLLEQAHEGTLFLDEVGELPLDLQPRLLRAVEAREVRPVGGGAWRRADARIVAATNRDLRALVSRGAFRQDLYFRLAGLEVRVPSLRERKEDIGPLVHHFLASERPARSLDELPPFALELLAAYDWPGNVRELRNVVRRLLLFPGEAEATLEALGGRAEPDEPGSYGLPLREARERAIEAFERRYLAAVMKRHDGKVSSAAGEMGVSRQFAYRLLARHGIRPRDEGTSDGDDG